MQKKFTKLDDIKIPREFWGLYKRLGEELKYSNRFNISKDLKGVIEKYIQYHLKRKVFALESGGVFYRARINAIDKGDPYGDKEMGAPPRGLAASGRINPDGISYLYLAKSIETAIAEVRPWVGAKISVAKFALKRNVEIVSLNPRKISNLKDYEMVDVFRDVLNSVPLSKYYFATPAHSADRLAYLPSQYLAELFKSEGVDGIEYGSVLNRNGENLALFDTSAAECVGVELHLVEEVNYSSSLVEAAKD
ncbi:RES family NAD+ phosphorylase [Stenotrophomonas rhizophila]